MTCNGFKRPVPPRDFLQSGDDVRSESRLDYFGRIATDDGISWDVGGNNGAGRDERAMLALTEATTRCADSTDAVPDEIWKEASKHFDQPQLAALVLNIAMINFWNRVNLATRQVVGG